MEGFKKFKLFGLYFYVSSIRMRPRRTIDEKMRNQRKILKGMRPSLYKDQNGCCPMCGRHLEEYAMELHHKIGVSESPHLALNRKNLVLLCHNCHVEIHKTNKITEE
jgi:5-methylcytosine-specific restriction endonuclease McrA